ncbi:alpha/beta hydrolase [Solimonas sp. K1W22B-7]|uniref:alpha/beta fold hydrolase n=1 Tax=Solimonas sp. K1W22B-7 TaxID=2303331 RepID=UPI000E33128C|nr:alpha/beta hydrolase [Solimonas sp. K1W22B-7]AXQ31242.1 alpha/beta hydrolase [Solimonas sp. K1W22B-7]
MKRSVVVLLVVLLLLVGLPAGFVAATWAPDRPVAELRARWAKPPSSFLEIGGMEVHVRDEGPISDRVPVILLHGTSSSLHTWDGWAEALKTQRRVIRIDLPGFGLTGPAPDGDYSIDAYMRFLNAVFDHYGAEGYIVAGNSFGGRLAWEAALALPSYVQKIVLVDAAGYPLPSESVPLGFRLARMPLLAPLMERTLPRSVIASSVRNVYGDPSKVTPELIDRYYELTLRAGNRKALAQRFAQNGGDTSSRIRVLKLPTLILWGGRDQLIPPASATRFHREIQGSQLVMFDDLGHVPQEEDPLRTVKPVLGFLGPALPFVRLEAAGAAAPVEDAATEAAPVEATPSTP